MRKYDERCPLHEAVEGLEWEANWCPGHTGVEGNEAADREARTGALSPVTTEEPPTLTRVPRETRLPFRNPSSYA